MHPFCIWFYQSVWSSWHGFKWSSCHTPSETRSNMETVDMMFLIIKRRTHTYLSSYIYTLSKMLHFWRKHGIFWKINAPSETFKHSRPFILSLQISWSKCNITRSLPSLKKQFLFSLEGKIEGQVFLCWALWTRS